MNKSQTDQEFKKELSQKVPNWQEKPNCNLVLNSLLERCRGILQNRDNKKTMPYQFEIIRTIQGSCDDVWNFELMMKRGLKQFHYTPKLEFGDHATECFKIT